MPGFLWGWGTGLTFVPQRKPVPQRRVGGFDPDSNSARKRDQRVSMLPAGISTTLGNGHSCSFSRVSTFTVHHHHLCPSNMNFPTTTKAQNKAGIGRRGVLHPFSQQGTYFFHTDNGTPTNYSFLVYTHTAGTPRSPTTFENKQKCSFLMVVTCFSSPPPNHPRK